MPPLEECTILIPTATLEDFPSDLSDYEACSMLAGWTVLWHPRLLAATGQLPTWSRADSPPDPKPGGLIVVPAPSLDQLPPDFQSRVDASADCHLITGGSRSEILAEIARIRSDDQETSLFDPPPILHADRHVGAEDFYAAGYAYLQIQVMTQRLRYTSNLDQIHLQNRMVAAANSFLDDDAKESIAALHDVFDCLAEERDHYFSSSDPHLIDLTLVTPSTVQSMLDDIDAIELVNDPDGDPDGDPDSESNDLLATPINLLIDQDAADAIEKVSDARLEKLRKSIASNQVGWAGGGPSASQCIDTMTLAEAEQAIAEAHAACKKSVGVAPTVFARFTGGWSGDMAWSLNRLGYRAAIPIDFATGTGHGDEAKVLLEAGDNTIEALTTKPIDASSDAAFLTLGWRLGEAIDGGEIATALFAHWPGQGCDSFFDVRRASTWSLCLGKFWRLDDYFSEGEHPYHHTNVPAVSKSAASVLDAMVQRGDPDPISSLTRRFCDAVDREQKEMIAGLADLVAGDPSGTGEPLSRLVHLVAADGSDGQRATMLVNPSSIGRRETVAVDYPVSSDPKHIYASWPKGSGAEVTVDIPACGFVLLSSKAKSEPRSRSLAQRIRGKFVSGGRPLANKERSDGSVHLQNEFMEVVIGQSTGGVSGVYSGAIRGNRFSMKLVRHQADGGSQSTETTMRSDSIKIVTSTPAIGRVETTGKIEDAENQQILARFVLRYSLDRGSRVLQVSGELTPTDTITGSPWQHYFAVRAAVGGDAAIYQPMIRSKVHRRSSRRIVAPLGVVIDEAERQTLVGSCGLAFHRQVGDRFLDTLVAVESESCRHFKLSYGFDLPSPVAAAQSLITSPVATLVSVNPDAAPIGWILHSTPNTVNVSRLCVDRRADGRLAALVRLTQTRSQPCKATIRFLRDVEAAIVVDSSSHDLLDQPVPHSEDRKRIATEGDRVSISIPGHGVADLLVIFRDSDSA